MLGAVNLRAEVFVDEYDDGSVGAEAALLRVDDRRVFAHGSATFVSSDWSAAGMRPARRVLHSGGMRPHRAIRR